WVVARVASILIRFHQSSACAEARAVPASVGGKHVPVRRLVPVGILAIALVVAIVPGSLAADQVTVPTAQGQTVTVSWTGSVLPGANPGSDCSGAALSTDPHVVSILVPAGTYQTVSVLATASVTFN